MLENILQLFKYFPELNASLGAGLLIFARFMGFVIVAPILSRKDVLMIAKLSFILILTISFVGILHPKAPPPGTSLFLSVILNTVFGALIGFITSTIFVTITAAGDMINLQMGLSASSIFDPMTKEQTSTVGLFFGFLGTVLFINAGGFYWMFSAFERGFTVFPLYNTVIPFDKILNMNYLILLTSNVLFIGLQLAAPVLIATLSMDIILGIISKTAPQVNVFQLSFLFKPILGVAILIIILPLLINVINEYFASYSGIY
ncbi:MAG: flagellar biosynthetic protein FliR [Candidatus Gastranaerophilales bacterium]|nr:flagellar biosynthetic protein FliR [Candidatus Gastranaerophilales bacterium]